MIGYREWSARDAAAHIAVPVAADDKYSRGVLGVLTGSEEYPGAAVLSVEAALRTGVGMVRYLGPVNGVASGLVLQRRPEAVTAPGRVQAWLIGSGMDASTRTDSTTDRIFSALADGSPAVIDSGALDLIGRASGPVVVTPHYRELAALLSHGDAEASTAETSTAETSTAEPSAADIAADPARWCALAAERLGVTVLLKGSRTYIAAPDGTRLVTPRATPWLATAGTGDALGGILGALLATHSVQALQDSAVLARLAATAAMIHARAGERASGGGPLTVLDLTVELSATVADFLHEQTRQGE